MDEKELVHGQMDEVVVWALMDGDITVGGEHDSEGWGIRGQGRRQSSEDGFASEDGNAIDGHDKSADILATDVANPRSGGTGNYAGNIAAFADVAGGDEEAKRRMFTFDRLSDGIQPVEGVIGHLQVKWGHDGAIGGNNTVGGQETKGLDIGRSGGKVVHAFVEAGMGGCFDM